MAFELNPGVPSGALTMNRDRHPHGRVRHPQYDACMLIMLGFLLQWPTLLTLLMLPVLALMYLRLARYGASDTEREFGALYRDGAARVPAFLPRFDAEPRPQRACLRSGADFYRPSRHEN